MWEKLCYSLTRSETSEMLTIVQYIFCTLTAFQILHKSNYDSFILRKLDFGKLIHSISDRFKGILSDVWALKHSQANTTEIRNKLQVVLQRPDIDNFLIKMEVHLLRLFTPEFIHSNVKQHGEQDNQLLTVYYRSIFSIEMIRGCIRDESFAFTSYEPAFNFLS